MIELHKVSENQTIKQENSVSCPPDEMSVFGAAKICISISPTTYNGAQFADYQY
jgi:hypothetical protein